MPFSYATSEPTDVDKIRGRIGDTLQANHYLEDETIASILLLYPSVLTAAIECVRRILAKIAKDPDRAGMGITSTRSQIFTHYQDLMKLLVRERDTGATMYVGGWSKSENQALREDPDFRQPEFALGQDDNPGAGGDG